VYESLQSFVNPISRGFYSGVVPTQEFVSLLTSFNEGTRNFMLSQPNKNHTASYATFPSYINKLFVIGTFQLYKRRPNDFQVLRTLHYHCFIVKYQINLSQWHQVLHEKSRVISLIKNVVSGIS